MFWRLEVLWCMLTLLSASINTICTPQVLPFVPILQNIIMPNVTRQGRDSIGQLKSSPVCIIRHMFWNNSSPATYFEYHVHSMNISLHSFVTHTANIKPVKVRTRCSSGIKFTPAENLSRVTKTSYGETQMKVSSHKMLFHITLKPRRKIKICMGLTENYK